MNIAEFKRVISSIKEDKNIHNGRRGSEENVKIKIIIPLLQYLGFDVVQDMDFESLGADIVILDDNSKPCLVVETKAWDQLVTDHLDQCLEYMFKLRVPFILISSGQHTCLYSGLINLDNLSKVKPILEFTFFDLLKDGDRILTQLELLIGKDVFKSGAKLLYEKAKEQLPPNTSSKEAMTEFLNKCVNFKSVIKTIKITDKDFISLARKHSDPIYKCLIFAKDEFVRIAQENNRRNVRIRYRSKEIGLEYLLATQPRPKVIGLVGIYPEKSHIAFGLEGWKELKCPEEYMMKMKSFPRSIETREQVVALVNLVESAIKIISNN